MTPIKKPTLTVGSFMGGAPREIARAIHALIYKDVMYASNAGAFACRPSGAVLRMSKFDYPQGCGVCRKSRSP